MNRCEKLQKLSTDSRSQKQYLKYLFILKPIDGAKYPCHYSQTHADFSPCQPAHGIVEPILPVFNKDGRYWSRSFIYAYMKDYYMSNPGRQKRKFQQKLLKKTEYEKLSEHSPLFLPIPNNTYCQVCHQSMEEGYENHIKSLAHLRKQNKSLGSQYINDLIKTKYKSKRILKETNSKKEKPAEQKHCLKYRRKVIVKSQISSQTLNSMKQQACSNKIRRITRSRKLARISQ